jgi:hypothetical protein
MAIRIPNPAKLRSVFQFEAFDSQCKVFSPGQQVEAIKSLDPNAPAAPLLQDTWFVAAHCGQNGQRFEFDVLVNTQDPIWEKKLNQSADVPFPVQVLDLGGGNRSVWQQASPLLLQLKYRGRFPELQSAFAIDVGTTNTCAAYWSDEGRPRLFNFRTVDESIPTVIFYRAVDPGGPLAYSIGVEAQQEVSTGDERRRRRRIKQQMDLPLGKRDLDLGLPNKRSVDDIYLDLIKEYLSQFQRQYQRRLKRMKATYPPEYPTRSRDAVREVYGKFGVEREPLFGVDEASAAAVYYFWTRFKDDHRGNLAKFRDTLGDEHQVMVFDMGGGTTDISIVSIKVDSRIPNAHPHGIRIKVLGTASLNNLGGDNFTVHVLRSIKCRLALAAARKFVEAAPARSPTRAQTERINALRNLRTKADEFQQLLDRPAPASETEEQMEKAFAELEDLADCVIPTRSARLQRALDSDSTRSLFEVIVATDTFLKLWAVAEQYKLQLVEREEVELDSALLGVGQSESLQALKLSDAELQAIKLRRDCDLYRRVRPLVRRAVLTCRSVMRDVSVNLTSLSTIQLVGNSCRIPLITETFIKELESDLPLVSHRIRFNEKEAKSCVALGACVASQINDFGIHVDYDISFEPAVERLGWEIGWWEPNITDFRLLFDSRQQPSKAPWVEQKDHVKLQRIRIWRRRPKSTGDPEMQPELLGDFILDPNAASGKVDKPAAPGTLRFRLLSYNDVALIRGNLLYQLQFPQGLKSIVRADPYSGWH